MRRAIVEANSSIYVFFKSVLIIYLVVWASLNVNFIKLGSIVPFRVAASCIGILFIAIVFDARGLNVFVKKYSWMIHCFLLFAVFGSTATLLNDGTTADVLLFLIKWILQPLFITCFVYQAGLILGTVAAYKCILVVFSSTFIVAILQWLTIMPAWEMVYFLESLQTIDKEITHLGDIEFDRQDGKFDDSARARGLSWSAIHLSYQACLAVGFGWYFMREHRASDPSFIKYLLLSIALACIAAVATGTRSAIAGIAFFLMLASWLHYDKKISLSILYVIVFFLIMVIFPLMQELFTVRVLQTEDSSAAMRAPLYYFGVLLSLDRPWGYGWIDESINHAQKFWSQVVHMEGADSIFTRGLHNYILNLLWVYGVAGVVLFFWFLKKLSQNCGFFFTISLVPYFINSLFHNGGMFYGGNYVWIFVALALITFEKRSNHN